MVFGGGEVWNKKTIQDYECEAERAPAPYSNLEIPCLLLTTYYPGLVRRLYILRHGTIQKHLFVCHHCDRSNCIEDSHLWLGTQKQNMHDASTKNRMNRVFSPEHCAAISAGKKGKVVTIEQRAKISASMRGRIRSPEHCANIADSKRRWWKNKKEKEANK